MCCSISSSSGGEGGGGVPKKCVVVESSHGTKVMMVEDTFEKVKKLEVQKRKEKASIIQIQRNDSLEIEGALNRELVVINAVAYGLNINSKGGKKVHRNGSKSNFLISRLEPLKGNFSLRQSSRPGPIAKRKKVKKKAQLGAKEGCESSVKVLDVATVPSASLDKNIHLADASQAFRGKGLLIDEEEYSHCCDSIKDSSLQQGNKRFMEEEKRGVAEKLWKSIVAIGVVGDEKDEAYIKVIQQMETRDCVGKKRLMADKKKGWKMNIFTYNIRGGKKSFEENKD